MSDGVTGLAALASEPFCYLTTTGRESGLAREIEIWWATDGTTVFMISGGGERSNWVRNLKADPRCTIRIGDRRLQAHARLDLAPGPERSAAARLLAEKYGRDPDAWARSAYLLAYDVEHG